MGLSKGYRFDHNVTLGDPLALRCSTFRQFPILFPLHSDPFSDPFSAALTMTPLLTLPFSSTASHSPDLTPPQQAALTGAHVV